MAQNVDNPTTTGIPAIGTEPLPWRRCTARLENLTKKTPVLDMESVRVDSGSSPVVGTDVESPTSAVAAGVSMDQASMKLLGASPRLPTAFSSSEQRSGLKRKRSSRSAGSHSAGEQEWRPSSTQSSKASAPLKALFHLLMIPFYPIQAPGELVKNKTLKCYGGANERVLGLHYKHGLL